MTAQVTVRRALSIESEEIQAVIRAANEEFRDRFPTAMFRSYLANAMDVAARRERGTVLVATLEDEIVGTITHYDDANDEGMPTRFPDGTAGLRATAVRPDLRGLGLGKALVQAVVDRATDRGAVAVALHTADVMHSAMALYARMGFVRDPDFDYPAGQYFMNDGHDDVVARAYVRRIEDVRRAGAAIEPGPRP